MAVVGNVKGLSVVELGNGASVGGATLVGVVVG